MHLDLETPANRPTVSVLCVTRNRSKMLLRCLESCRQQDYPAVEFVIIDNASDDDTYETVATHYPEATLIRMPRNAGVYAALNVAIANSSGDYLMTVDDDAFFMADDALRRLVEALIEEPELGAVTCAIEGPHEAPLPKADRYVPTYKAGFTMIPRQAFLECVGYYPDIFRYSAGEEYVCTALWDQGKRVKQLADVRMYHARTLVGRAMWSWGFDGLRGQILVCWMRDPWCLVAPRVASKFVRSFVHCIRRRQLVGWVAAWTNVWLHVPEAIRQRRPIRLATRRLLWQLRNGKPLPVTGKAASRSPVAETVEA